MKSSVSVCFIAVAIAAVFIESDSQSIVPVTRGVILQTAAPQVTQRPTYPHNCDCKGECKDLHHSRVPFKLEDFHKYLSYESFPIYCRDASSTFFKGKKYTCKQTFDCCRKCNWLFYRCLKVLNQPYGNCIRAAYKCMCNCIDNHPVNLLPFRGK